MHLDERRTIVREHYSGSSRPSKPRAAAVGPGTTGNSEFPGLREVIREVEAALALRETRAVVDHIDARMPQLIAQFGDQLPDWVLTAAGETYRRVELHFCPLQGFQVVAMVWGPGQGTPVHDHRDVWGIESVWRGELEVVDFGVRASAGDMLLLAPSHVARVREGESIGFVPEQGLHLCRNPSARDVTVSLHVYARPLDRFNEYIDQGDGWYQRRDHVPPIEH